MVGGRQIGPLSKASETWTENDLLENFRYSPIYRVRLVSVRASPLPNSIPNTICTDFIDLRSATEVLKATRRWGTELSRMKLSGMPWAEVTVHSSGLRQYVLHASIEDALSGLARLAEIAASNFHTLTISIHSSANWVQLLSKAKWTRYPDA